jgi:acetyl esterase
MPSSRERTERAVALAMGALPEFVRVRLLRDRPVTGGVALDSRVAMLMQIARSSGRAFQPEVTVEAFRRGYRHTNKTMGLRTPGNLVVRDLQIPASDGDIGARLYRPAVATSPLPLLVYFHGGGFVIGDVEGTDHLARFFALRGNIAVLSVDYRLGPENRFPRAHEDAFTAYAYATHHASELGADPRRIAVGGDSAGGGLSAGISAFATSRELAPPAAQMLIYPSVDASTLRPSRTAFESGVPLTTSTIRWFSQHYINDKEERHSPLLSPLLGPAPSGTWTYVLAAGFDPLVDEAHAYAERLRAAGDPVILDLRPTLPHGFVIFAGVVPEARRALEDAIDATAAALREIAP